MMGKLDELREYYDKTDISAELENATYEEAEAPPVSERMTTFAVRLPVPVLDRVREIAAQEGVTTSALLRQWIEAGVLKSSDEGPGERVVSVGALYDFISRASERAAS